MMDALSFLSPDMGIALAKGISLNFRIALAAFGIGLLGGLVAAAIIRARVPILSGAMRFMLAIMRAVPVFIAMFFFVGILRSNEALLIRLTGNAAMAYVVLACLPYAISYIADQFLEAFRRWHTGDRRVAILAIPNIARAFQVLFTSSCFGAAIGVPEAMSVIIREAETLGNTPSRFMLFTIAILAFTIVMQCFVFVTRLLHRVLERQFIEPTSSA